MSRGERIRSVRERLGLTGEQLAKKLGVKKQAVSNWERDETSITVDNLLALADLGKVSPTWLLLGDDGDDDDPLVTAIRQLEPEHRTLVEGIVTNLQKSPEKSPRKKIRQA